MISSEEYERYQRQIRLPEWGEAGQARLRQGRVLVVGAGGLGCPVLLYLAAAGVGTLGIVDGDVVSESNLPRQTLYGTTDVGKPKTEAAARRLREANPFVQLVPHARFLDRTNALEIISSYDLVIDCTDTFAARYLINDACALLDQPFVYGAIHQFEGQVAVFNYRAPAPTTGAPTGATPLGPTYRCLFPEPPPPHQVPTCAEAGVIGVLPGIIGLYQANEALKILTGLGHILSGELLILDLLQMTTRRIRLRRRPEADHTREMIDYEAYCPTGASQPNTITSAALHRHLTAGEAWAIIDVREPEEYARGRLPTASLLPAGEILSRVHQIPRDKPVVVYCQRGTRSAEAIRQLQAQGFARLYNLVGGIDAWARGGYDYDP